MPSYRMRLAGKTAEVFLYDEIGDGFFGGISAKQFADDLNKMGKVDVLNVRVNSPGGDVFQGLAIYNTLKRHPARVVVDIDGMALSIASIISMAGDEIRMAGNAMFMIHDPMSGLFGTAEEHREKADLMDQVKENLVNTYAARTNMEAADVAQMMADETWMQASDALKHGFVDSITDEIDMAACFNLSRYRHAPKSLSNVADIRPGANVYRAKIQEMTRKVSG